MRRTFKEHIYGFCMYRGYNVILTEYEQIGHWTMQIGEHLQLFSMLEKQGWYILIDNLTEERFTCRASEWDLMTKAIDKFMSQQNNA